MFVRLRNKYFIDQVSIFLSFLELSFPHSLFHFLFFLFFHLLLFDLFKPHILFVLRNLMIDWLGSLFLLASINLFPLNVLPFMLFYLPEIDLVFLLDHFLFLLDLTCFQRQFFLLLQNDLFLLQLLQKPVTLLLYLLSLLFLSLLLFHTSLYLPSFQGLCSFLFLNIPGPSFLILLSHELIRFLSLFLFPFLNLLLLLLQLLD